MADPESRSVHRDGPVNSLHSYPGHEFHPVRILAARQLPFHHNLFLGTLSGAHNGILVTREVDIAGNGSGSIRAQMNHQRVIGITRKHLSAKTCLAYPVRRPRDSVGQVKLPSVIRENIMPRKVDRQIPQSLIAAIFSPGAIAAA